MSNTNTNEVAGQHAIIGNVASDPKENFKRTEHPDAQWFPKAGLGLFLHLGISSVSGECDISWSMMKQDRNRKRDVEQWGLFATGRQLTPANYWAMAKDLKVDRFNPRQILSAAKAAGFSYAVLTTKHHEGFALWPSKVGDFNIGQNQAGRDIVKEYADGCRAAGLKVGFYYSPPDWYFNRDYMSFQYGGLDYMSDRLEGNKPDVDIHHQPVKFERTKDEIDAWKAKYRAFVRAQVEELLTNYGTVDLLWFDGNLPGNEQTISMDEIRALQPGIVVDPRGHGYGDYATSECRFPEKRHPDWWEYCHVGYDGGWGYRDHDGYKPAGWILSELVKTRSWGGNFLLNYGPDSHGELPEVYYKRMAQIGKWMEKHAESVFDVEPGPWPERSDVPITVRGKTCYLHFDYLNDGLAVLKDVQRPVEVKLLRTGDAVPFEFGSGTLKISLSEELRTTLVDTVKVTF